MYSLVTKINPDWCIQTDKITLKYDHIIHQLPYYSSCHSLSKKDAYVNLLTYSVPI